MTNLIEIDTTTEKAIEAKQGDLLTSARSLIIVSPEDNERAVELLRGATALGKEIDALFDPPIRAAHDSHKKMLAAKEATKRPVEDAKKILSGKQLVYRRDQERLAAEQAAVAQAAVRKAQEDRQLAEAARLEAMGRKVEAEAFLNRPTVVPVVAVAAAPVEVAGQHVREIWKARITDFGALVRHVAANPEYLNYVLPNEPALNAAARSQKQALALPGVEAEAEQLLITK